MNGPAAPENRFASWSPGMLSRVRVGFLLLFALGIGWIEVKRFEAPTPPARASGAVSKSQPAGVSPDLTLYRQLVEAVRRGEDYHAAAGPLLREWGFPVRSVFNWRLPTFAWLFAALPGPLWIQGLLLALGAVNLAWLYVSLRPRAGFVGTALLMVAQAGVLVWAFPTDAFYATELWAGQLLLLAWQLRWRGHVAAAIGVATLALCFRELCLPFLLLMACFALRKRRWAEAAGWGAGLVLFFAFLAWHAGQVRLQLTPHELAGAVGVAPWLQFNGLTFALESVRINGVLLELPAEASWLFLLATLAGLWSWKDEAGEFLLVLLLAYLAAFCCVGTLRNLYWGLLIAPLLNVGIAFAPQAAAAVFRRK